jgi:circadian clock protein KaiC
LLTLKRFFLGRGCTVLLLDAGSASKIGDLQSDTMVHGVVRLEQSLPSFGLKRRRLTIVKLRGVRFDDGYHDYKVETGGLRVYPRVVPINGAAGAGGSSDGRAIFGGLVPSGLAELDALLGGGLTYGSSAILLGPAGAGKSTLAGKYVTTAAERGEPAVVFTFDESVEIFLARSEGVGMRMRDKVAAGLIRVVQVDPGELAPGEFAHMVRSAVERDGARVVVIDSLNGYLNATPDERFLVVQLHELLSFLGSRGVCTLLVVAQHGLLGHGMEAALDASYLADAVVMLRYFEYDGRVRKAISVVKKRTGWHEQTIREFEIVPGQIRVGQPLVGFHGVLTGVPQYDGAARALMGGGDDRERA